MRMSYSSIIRELEDFGAALIDLQNRQMAEAKQSTPLQSGPIPGYIRGLRRLLAERSESIEPGDVFMHNDPYAGATHGPDVAFVVPAFHHNALAGFAVTTAHHLDIGAHTPGSGGIVDAIDCYAEGLRFQVELFSGSYGGRYGSDGLDSVDVLYANTRNNPIEDIESHVPLRIERYELRENAAAPGQWRGGVGSIREITFLADGAVSIESEGHKYPPKGLFGGSDGTPSQLIWTKTSGEVVQLPSKLPYHPFGQGDRITAIRACGGAYGNPLDRDPSDVLDDVLDEFIGREKALADYGVVISKRFEIDPDATARERQLRRRASHH